MSASGPLRKASNSRDDWRTPPELWELLNGEFRFTLDGAANTENHLCDAWLGPGAAGIEDAFDWRADLTASQRIYVNPPYGRCLNDWVPMFDAWRQNTHTVVALLPANTDSQWFARIYDTAHEIRLLSKRVSFVKNDGFRGANTGGSLVAVWRPRSMPPTPHIWLWKWRT